MEVLELWRVCCLVGASTCLEARGLGGFLRLSGQPEGCPGWYFLSHRLFWMDRVQTPSGHCQHEAVCERSEHASASEASALARAKRARWCGARGFVHMRRTNTWHFLQQSGQFLRLSGQARSEAEGGPTASKIDHFVEGNATCWSDACENAGCSPALTCSLRSH